MFENFVNMFVNFANKFMNAFIYSGGYKLMLSGLLNTLIISVFALIIGVIAGTFIAILKVMPKSGILGHIAETIANFYLTVIRGTPVTVQLLLVYYGFLESLEIPAIVIASLVFGINSGAYVAEIIRSGILAVDNGQMEAGRSLGLTYPVTMSKIILPQAIKNILPALGNELIVLIKETSVAGFITVFDLTRAARNIVAKTYDAFVPYTVLALVYLAIVVLLTFLLNKFERWLRRSDNR